MKLSTSDEIVIKAIKPKYALKIEKLKSQNFGMYTCRASNDLGTSEAVTEITGKILSKLKEWFYVTLNTFI